MKYQRKYTEIEAVQWNGSNTEEVKKLIGDSFIKETEVNKDKALKVKTTYGIKYIFKTNYIIKDGEFGYSLTDVEFNKEFEPIKITKKATKKVKED